MTRRRALPWLAVLLYAAGCLAVPATTLAVVLAAPAGCACDGSDADCCGASCCAPAAPSCCSGGSAPEAAADVTWDPRCTCGGHDPATPAHLALDLHVAAAPAASLRAPGCAPLAPPAPERLPCAAPAPDDPVPRSCS